MHVLDEAEERRAAKVAYHAHHANPFAKPLSFEAFLPKCLRVPIPSQPEHQMQAQFRHAMKRWPTAEVKRNARRQRRIG